jgi:hypothetical protein
MIRLACVSVLVALGVVIALAVRTDGMMATLFSFVGVPALVFGLTLYLVARWRAGAFRSNGT